MTLTEAAEALEKFEYHVWHYSDESMGIPYAGQPDAGTQGGFVLDPFPRLRVVCRDFAEVVALAECPDKDAFLKKLRELQSKRLADELKACKANG